MTRVQLIRRVAWLVSGLPAIWLLVLVFVSRLGADPVGFLTRATGDWSLRFLLLALLVTPLYRWSRWSVWLPLRRVAGLAAFYYGVWHLGIYWVMSNHWAATPLRHDLRRPYIDAGYVALLVMVPLALTSTDRSMRALGRRWKTLHRLVYVAGVAAVAHYALLVKIDFTPAIHYAVVLALLLGVRLWWLVRRPPARAPVAPANDSLRDRPDR